MATEMNETTQEPVAVWLRNPRTGMVNLVVHPETIRRCLSEGHTVVPDPRLPASVDPPTEAPTPDAQADPKAVAALEQATVAAVHERNNAARGAFDAIGSPSPAETRKPARGKRA